MLIKMLSSISKISQLVIDYTFSYTLWLPDNFFKFGHSTEFAL